MGPHGRHSREFAREFGRDHRRDVRVRHERQHRASLRPSRADLLRAERPRPPGDHLHRFPLPRRRVEHARGHRPRGRGQHAARRGAPRGRLRDRGAAERARGPAGPASGPDRHDPVGGSVCRPGPLLLGRGRRAARRSAGRQDRLRRGRARSPRLPQHLSHPRRAGLRAPGRPVARPAAHRESPSGRPALGRRRARAGPVGGARPLGVAGRTGLRVYPGAPGPGDHRLCPGRHRRAQRGATSSGPSARPPGSRPTSTSCASASAGPRP